MARRRNAESRSPGTREKILEAAERLIAAHGAEGFQLKDVADAGRVNWANLNSITDFYRKYNPATIWEKLEVYRLANMLSSPATQSINTTSNLFQSLLLRPTTLTATGVTDALVSGLTGRARQRFASEGLAYARGAARSVRGGFQAFRNSWKGELNIRPDMRGAGTVSLQPDLPHIPVSNARTWKVISLPLRFMEATDQFFLTMNYGAERAALARRVRKGGSYGVFDDPSLKARETVFRAPVDPTGKLTGQGGALQAVDKVTDVVINKIRGMEFGERGLRPFHWLIPFVQTPMNILKQGIEYSPAGYFTMAGTKAKTEQFAKATIGTSVFGVGALLAAADRTTWAPPKSGAERQLFYATGRKPYSIKIGDRWVSYQRIGPLAFPIAMAAAYKAKAIDEPDVDAGQAVMASVAAMAEFFSDQSYMRGLGNLVDAGSGDERTIGRLATDLPKQVIPASSMIRWVNRLVDDTYRDPVKFRDGALPSIVQNFMKDFPGLSGDVKPFLDPAGQPSRRSFNTWNAFMPIVTQSAMDTTFERAYESKKLTNDINTIKRKIKAVAEDPTLTPDEKKSRIAALQREIREFSEGAKSRLSGAGE